jgi:hypothetical protein
MGFGSLEAALTTTADVKRQIALAGGPDLPCRAAGIINGGPDVASQKLTKQSEMSVRVY